MTFKVGDEVAVINPFQPLRLEIVVKADVLHVTLSDGSKWCHSGWPFPRPKERERTRCIVHATNEHRAEIAARAQAPRYVAMAECPSLRGFRSGLLRAAEECEGYAAVVADEYDDGPHSVHADVARHLARKLREIADRDAPAMQPDPPPSAEALANRLRAMLDEAMSEYPSLRVKFSKALAEMGGSDG